MAAVESQERKVVIMLSRCLCVLFMCLFCISVSNAQPLIDIGQDDNKPAKTEKKEEKEDKSESKTMEEAKDSRGLFSFMNFSFGKKEEKKKEGEEEEENSLEKLIRDAEEGSNADAQIMLGYLYLYGDGDVKPNYKKAFHYYSLAAAQDDKVAVNNLGSLYYSGIGTERNTLKAAEMFDKAVSLGNSEAAVNLAFMYLTGMGINKDSVKAVHYFSIAAEAGNPTAQFMYGYAYYKGFVVSQDYRKAFGLIKDAALAKYDAAEYILARMYLSGEGITKNYGNAVKFFTAAANQGNIEAMTALGDILADGKVYNADLYKAHVLFNVASVYGAPKAAYKRDLLEKSLKIEELLQAQTEAEKFSEKPSDLTSYVRKTFGNDIKKYIDEAMQRKVL